MGSLKTTRFDAAKYISTPQDIAELLNDALETGHAGYIAAALGVAARAKGMTKVAGETGVKRQALYAALSEDGNPTLETLTKVLASLGLKLHCDVDDKQTA